MVLSIKGHQQLRRLYEAAERDRNRERFFEDFAEALKAGDTKPEDFSIRQLFEQFVPNGRELVDSWNPRQGGGVSLLEAGDAVQMGAFANITGQIVYSAVLEKYSSEEFVFTKLIPTQSTPFNGEKIPGVTQLGDMAEEVGEAQPYPLAGVTEDWIETPQTKKRGMIDQITKEALFFDRTGLILERCGEVGYWLGVNKEKRAIDCIIDENTTAHRYKWRGTTYATYQTTSPWDNVTASNTLADWSDLDAAEQTFNAMVDPNTGETIDIEATHLIVVKSLEAVANYILNATEIQRHIGGYAVSGNLTQEGGRNPYANKYQLVTSKRLATRLANDAHWFLGTPGKYAKYMENWPLAVVQASPNSEDEFNRDIVTKYKASERGAFSVVEPRVMVSNQ